MCVFVCVGAFMTQQWTPLQVKSYPEECSLTDVFACHSSFPLTGNRARGRRHADRSSKCFFYFFCCFCRQRPIVTDGTMPLYGYGLQIVSSRLGLSLCGGNVCRSCQLHMCTGQLTAFYTRSIDRVSELTTTERKTHATQIE